MLVVAQTVLDICLKPVNASTEARLTTGTNHKGDMQCNDACISPWVLHSYLMQSLRRWAYFMRHCVFASCIGCSR